MVGPATHTASVSSHNALLPCFLLFFFLGTCLFLLTCLWWPKGALLEQIFEQLNIFLTLLLVFCVFLIFILIFSFTIYTVGNIAA